MVRETREQLPERANHPHLTHVTFPRIIRTKFVAGMANPVETLCANVGTEQGAVLGRFSSCISVQSGMGAMVKSPSKFTAALFTTARTWKRPRSASADEWTGKLRSVCTTEYHAAIKRSTSEAVSVREVNPEPVQSEVRKRKQTPFIHTNIRNLERRY